MFALALKVTEFFQARASVQDCADERGVRVFCERAERGARELKPARVVRHLQPREDTETLRVAFVSLDVRDLRRA